jgi:hypothetical protein|tara:strand:- start:2684 stop:2932 length:249 start_codon:yes stop_codon:yes gene_type:complete
MLILPMQNDLILERIESLRGRKSYEEKKAAKLGFASLYEYFEDKITNEAKALQAEQASNANLSKLKKKKAVVKKQTSSCSCC